MSRQSFNYQPEQQSMPPKQKVPKIRFRWYLVWIIVAVVIFLYLLNGADPSFSFGDFMDFIGIEDKDRFRLYVTLGCICVAGVAVLRILKDSRHQRGCF